MCTFVFIICCVHMTTRALTGNMKQYKMDECVRWKRDNHGYKKPPCRWQDERKRGRQQEKKRKGAEGLTLPCCGPFEFKLGSQHFGKTFACFSQKYCHDSLILFNSRHIDHNNSDVGLLVSVKKQLVLFIS